jgi:cytoskeletal protein CcmA (bactofilin family)
MLDLNSLPTPEKRLWSALKTGSPLSLLDVDSNASRNVAFGATWSEERTIRAEVLGTLATSRALPEDLETPGIRLEYARVTGHLDFASQAVLRFLEFTHCYFDGIVDAREARGQRLTFSGCQLYGFWGDQLELRGDLSFPNSELAAIIIPGAHIGGSLNLKGVRLSGIANGTLGADDLHVGKDLDFTDAKLDGRVRLSGADVTGDLTFTGAAINVTEGYALDASGIHIGQSVDFGPAFRATSELRLRSARVGETLNIRHAHVSSSTGNAIVADDLRVVGDVHIVDAIISGCLRLSGAAIDGQLRLSGSEVRRRGDVALLLDSAKIGQSMFLRDGVTIRGETRLVGMEIAGQLDLSDSLLANDSKQAVLGDKARVGEDVFTGREFRTEGNVRLRGARIIGTLDFGAAALVSQDNYALLLDHADIQQVDLPQLVAPVGTISMRHAKIGVLVDECQACPYSAALDGCVYEKLESTAMDYRSREAWLAAAVDGFSRQPYEQLADVYRKAGRDDDARGIAFAKERARRDHLRLAGRMWNRTLHYSVGFGYQIWRAVAWLAVLFLAGSLIFTWAEAHHQVLPLANTRLVPSEHPAPAFHAWLYTLDALLPIVNLDQKQFWETTGFPHVWYVISVLSGWLLVTIVLAAMTARLVRD